MVSLSFALDGIDTSGLSGGADLHVRALPWPARDHDSSHFTGSARLGGVAFTHAPFFCLEPDAAALRLMQNVPGGAAAALTVASLASGTASLRGSLVYRV